MWSRSCLLSHEPYKQHLLVRESPPQEGASTEQSTHITYSRLKTDASTVSIVSLAIIEASFRAPAAERDSSCLFTKDLK